MMDEIFVFGDFHKEEINQEGYSKVITKKGTLESTSIFDPNGDLICKFDMFGIDKDNKDEATI